jgi:hypothetical protein
VSDSFELWRKETRERVVLSSCTGSQYNSRKITMRGTDDELKGRLDEFSTCCRLEVGDDVDGSDGRNRRGVLSVVDCIDNISECEDEQLDETHLRRRMCPSPAHHQHPGAPRPS